MARFDRQVATAKKLIAKNGKDVIWRVPGFVTPNPDRPWENVDVLPVDHPVRICFLPLNKEMRETIAFRRGTEVTAGSVMGYMAQVPFEPSVADKVIDGVLTYDIDSIDVLAPNGQKILYTVVFKL